MHPALRRGRLPARVWVNGLLVGDARGRPHAVLGRHHPMLDALGPADASTVRAEDDPHDLDEAARQAGLAAGAALHLVPAHDRHLADGVAGARRAAPTSTRSAGRRTSRAGRSRFEARVGGDPVDDLSIEVTLRHGERAARATTATACIDGEVRPPHRAVRPRHRRLPQRAAVEPGAPDAARCRRRAVARRRSVDRRVQLVHGAALGRHPARPLHAQRPALPAAAWCSTRATGPTRCWRRPSDAALRRDVELAKAMGFNGVRKHQKIEDPRYLYWADRLGLLVWEEMPSRVPLHAHGRSSGIVREWTEAIERDYSHPCIDRLGAVQRIVGRARAARGARAAPRRGGAVSPDQDARPDAAGDRQRRLGIAAPPTSSASTTTTRTPTHMRQRYGAGDRDRAAVRPAPARRAHPDARRLSAPRPADHADRVRRHRASRSSPSAGATKIWGYTAAQDRRGIRAHCTSELLEHASSTRRCSAASATRSSPTPSRRPTACSLPTARRRFRSSASRAVTTSASRTYIPGAA